MQQEQIDLGHKRTCPHCGAKYYDFYQEELDCPQCGKSIEAINITKPKRGRKAGISVATPTKSVKENDELKDLNFLIEKDCKIKIFTAKNEEGLDTIRHDTAHILAMAVQELFPGTQVTIGPVIDNGFYYDVDLGGTKISADNFGKIEKKMLQIR